MAVIVYISIQHRFPIDVPMDLKSPYPYFINPAAKVLDLQHTSSKD